MSLRYRRMQSRILPIHRPRPRRFARYLAGMNAVLPLDQMTTEEKLRAMEALWADLSAKADNFESPAWHGDVLRARDQRIAEGKEPSLDWADAKRQLRDRLR